MPNYQWTIPRASMQAYGKWYVYDPFLDRFVSKEHESKNSKERREREARELAEFDEWDQRLD